jgi:predicted O-methyltransferase YrrM
MPKMMKPILIKINEDGKEELEPCYVFRRKIIKEGLYYLRPEYDEDSCLAIDIVTTRDFQEYYYYLMFSDIDCIKKANLKKELFINNFSVEGGQLDKFEKVFLYNFIQKIKPKNIIEFSPAEGCSTVIISKALSNLNIVPNFFETHEINEKFADTTEFTLYDFDIDFVKVKRGDVFKTMNKDNLSNADFIFIDSDHGREFAQKYVDNFFLLIKSQCWVAVHDIRFHKLYKNEESFVIKSFIENNKDKIDTYFHITDLMKMFGIANDFKPCALNSMFFFRVK